MKPLVALYKAHRGGEWFDASLQSILPHVDGVVTVFSDNAWHTRGLDKGSPNNCREIYNARASIEKGAKEFHSVDIETPYQEIQYKKGLEVIREHFGEDTAVLIVDTDEVWKYLDLLRLKGWINEHPTAEQFRSRILTYVKSPLYQVYPIEAHKPVVALQNAKDREITGRFRTGCQNTVCNDVLFHHFSYVREDLNEIQRKFMATSSQEQDPSNVEWLVKVWPKIPEGQNLHMTPGSESCWSRIKILPGCPIDTPSFCNDIVYKEEGRWQNILESQHPDVALIPTPNHIDAEIYTEFNDIITDTTLLRSRLKTTYLESLVLYHLAGRVTPNGKILEIGSGSGGSTAVLAIGAPLSGVWCIDPFTPYDEVTSRGRVRGVREGNEGEFWETATHYGYVNRLRHLKMNSNLAAEHCPLFDLIFVDGNHSYNIVKEDLDLYWRKVKPGGFLVGHDYTTRFSGVIQAAQEWGPSYSVFAGTSLFYARKPL